MTSPEPRYHADRPDLDFSLVAADVAADKRPSSLVLRVVAMHGGFSGPAEDLIPLADTTAVSRVSRSVITDRSLPPHAIRVAIAFGVSVDQTGCGIFDES